MASCHITSWQIEGGESGSNDRFYFLDLQNDCWWWLQPLEIKRRLLLGRKAMTNLDGILKSRDITLPTNVHIIKAMVFPVIMYRCESWTIKKAECQSIDAFKLWCWKDPWDSHGTQEDQTSQSKRKSTLNIHWKDWCWSWNFNTGKGLILGKIEGRRIRGWQDEMVGWHHQLKEHEF